MATSVPTPRNKREKIYFSSLDTWNGYHSIPLEEESEKYFGFLTEFGRYAYKVAPQGFLGSGDHYVGVYDEIMLKLQHEEEKTDNSPFRCISNTEKNKKWTTPAWRRCIDDPLMWAVSEKQAFYQVMKYLAYCGKEVIVLNGKKMQIARTELEIFGFQMTQKGIMPSKNQLESIKKFPKPNCIRDIRAFMGLINQASWCESQKNKRRHRKPKRTTENKKTNGYGKLKTQKTSTH